MKTSNKILLTLLLSILGVFGAIHLTLYARLKKGQTTISPRPQTGWAKAYEGKAPAVISLVGNINVTIVPSDSFFVEVQEENVKDIHCGMEGKDSLLVRADSTDFLNPRDMFQSYSNFPWVSVHTGSHTSIQLRKLLALVKGSHQPGGPSLDMKAEGVQLWLGETYGTEGAYFPTEYYDSIHVQAVNSNVLLHANADIGKLSVQLDDMSELNDQHLKNLGSLHVQYTPRSKLNLTGATLDKLK